MIEARPNVGEQHMSDHLATAGTVPGRARSSFAAVDSLLARQPIFDREMKVFGYELLFRSGPENVCNHSDGDMATSQVLNSTLNVTGLTALLGGAQGFINFTRQPLLNGDYQLLPSQTTVVELLETVEPDEQVVNACRQVKDRGYTLALDDFIGDYNYKPLLGLVDIIKVDFIDSTVKQRQAFSRAFGGTDIRLLAEKVETNAEFEEAMELGYAYTQGFFFCEPQIVVRKNISASRSNYMLFLREVSRTDPDFNQVERIVKQEVSLSYKLLQYLNSAALGLGSKVTSIKQALTLLGILPLRRWASLVALTCLGDDKPAELTRVTLVRARFCELLGPDVQLADRQFDLFLLGLMSTLDALLDRPLDELLMELPLALDIKTALLGGAGELGGVLALAVACERGDVPTMATAAGGLGVTEAQIAAAYRDAILWADEVCRV